MILCITSTGNEMEAKVDTAFGRAPYFFLIDTETRSTEVIENRAAEQGQGAGIAAVQLVADKGVEAVVTGHVGPNAFQAFQASGIKLFIGASPQETVQEALARFERDEYHEASPPTEAPYCNTGRGRGGGGRGMGRGRGRCRRP
ncbi:MAG: NifB/NifX family molybdenum-iron cluster-binding protein [Pseudomonadota bacterium]